MNKTVCAVCFCPIEKNERSYSCVVIECNECVCEECMILLLKFSEGSGIIPKCPAEKCKGIYTLSNLKEMSQDDLSIYSSACFKYIMKDQGDVVKKRLQEIKILTDLRNERLKYLEQEYPKGILLTAKITFKDRLRSLDKQKSKLKSAQINKTNRNCMNVVCNGFLDPNFVCITCGTEFCNQCEVKITENHVCKQEDLDSVNIVNDMVKCPGCKLPVFKNEGCDSITCSNCNTNFEYSTGKLGGHGSSNAKLGKTISINKKERLSNIFEEHLNSECLELLLMFEALEPKIRTKDTILTPIKEYFSTNDSQLAKKKIAIKIDKYYNYMAKNRHYHKLLIKIEEKIRNKEDLDDLKEYLDDVISKYLCT